MRLLRKIIRKVMFIAVLVLIVFIISKHFRVIIPSTSMYPTLKEGDQFLAKEITDNDVSRGDICIFYKDTELYVKRLIGLPGDIVKINKGTVYINGCIIDEPYVENHDGFSGQFIVPENHYFFLGDNRANSNDSRYWKNPYIAADKIKGVVVLQIHPRIELIKEYTYEIY